MPSTARLRLSALLVLLAALLGARAEASGTDCVSGYPDPLPLQRAFELGAGVVERAERTGARVVLVARIGVDLRRYGATYTHVGWLWKPDAATPWRILHQLEICGTPQAQLYDTGPANFFMEGISRHQALVLIPSPALQARLHAALSGPLPQRLLGGRYNFFAHAFSPSDQNCTGWALEVLAAALAPAGQVQDRASAQAVLRSLAPPTLKVRPRWWQKLYVRFVLGNNVARLADQPDPQHYEMVTADTVTGLLLAQDAATKLAVVNPEREQAAVAP